MLTLLLYTYISIIGIQLIYFLGIFRSFAFYKEEKKRNLKKLPPVSVIICAKNESENLRENLPKIIDQNYPEFQVVLINDASSDDSLKIMEDFAKKHAFIKVVDVKSNETFWGNKKYALTLGIKAAKYDHLLFTDADCKVNSEIWISEMAGKFNDHQTIVLGYSPYKRIKKSFLNALIRFETLLTAIQYFSYARIGIPYMGVGRNLAYHKKEFFNAKGFIKHMHVKSGDDDLFIKEVAHKENTALAFSESSITLSEAEKSFKNWFYQKRRHISTSKHYKFFHKMLLGLFYISQFLFWLLLIILLVYQYQLILVISLAVLRFLVQFIIYGNSFKKLHDTSLKWFIPVLELFLIMFQFVIFIVNSFSKKVHWR
ncbi:glycosyltransferase [Leptobacterium flavescens]|uniref:Glycosyltransferase n=1 Tax=Leptobacterium flavescens TaxID=472055 RepID=A0A6P0UGK8_9FLAO|nr:glycosyltransferase [Leptobacterium flavescens]NER12374.1 glycosyltransferase [Leptobacterium flavescens]